jgi:dihydrofolate reductase
MDRALRGHRHIRLKAHSTLLANNLLDELRLLLHPVVVGSVQKLFADGPGARLALVAQRALSTGAVHLRYRPAT